MSDERSTAPASAKWGGWGFSIGKQAPHWFCYEHKAEGEKYIA